MDEKQKRKSLSVKTRFDVFKRDGFTCQYCGGKPPEVLLHCDDPLVQAILAQYPTARIVPGSIRPAP